MKKYLAEGVGTFALVFCGTGAMVIDGYTGGGIGNTGIAITFGLIVMAMIYSFGSISGAHINPAVTVAFAVAKIFPKKEIIPYVTAQCLGAILASTFLCWLFPDDQTLGATLPKITEAKAFILEVVLTFFLMLVILFTSRGDPSARTMAGFAIGAVVLLEALFAGPVTGASMNPARSLAPALVSLNFNSLWIYLMAPALGASLASWFHLAWNSLKS